MPGNFSIEREINKRIRSGEKFAFAYVDLDNFKAYNDKYGFYRGDKIIEFTSQILISAVKKVGSSKDFIGHIGGDDFVFITEIERARIICEYIIEHFDKSIPKFYNEEDVERAYILSRNRQGILMEFPLMSISILVVTNKEREINHPGQLSSLEGELKSYVKSLPGSNSIFDKRRSDHIDESYKENVSIIWLDVKNEDVMSTYKEIEKEGYQIYFSETSTEAIRVFSSLKPYLILVGSNVSLIEAYNMFNFLNTSPELIRIPVLMISPDSPLSEASNIKELGTDGEYFTKKVNIKDLLYKIHQAIDS
ncbi:MAG TPA: diguanylate cyclase [Bacteroidetes bacterium]|nr:diguanylate cyclase [Bacteroidota bacterium]